MTSGLGAGTVDFSFLQPFIHSGKFVSTWPGILLGP